MVSDVLVERPDGARLRVSVTGTADGGHPGASPAGADVLVLLQGQASSSSWWSVLRHRFTDRFRTVCLDYRGTGRTQSPPGPLSTGLLAADVVAVLDALDVATAPVYATSMGGRVGQVLAADHPDRVASLVLACTSPGGPHAVEQSTDAFGGVAAEPDPAGRVEAMLRLFYTPAWGHDPGRSTLLGDPGMTAADKRRHRRMSAAHDAWDRLPSIGCPTLVLHGSDDAITPAVNADLLAARIPGARLHVHQGGRHGFFDELADDLAPVLDRFWSDVG